MTGPEHDGPRHREVADPVCTAGWWHVTEMHRYLYINLGNVVGRGTRVIWRFVVELQECDGTPFGYCPGRCLEIRCAYEGFQGDKTGLFEQDRVS